MSHANFTDIPALSETGSTVSTTRQTLHRVVVTNLDATDVVYLKVFTTVAAPTYASDTPAFAIDVPPGAHSLDIGILCPAIHLQASSVRTASAAAPAATLSVLVIRG